MVYRGVLCEGFVSKYVRYSSRGRHLLASVPFGGKVTLAVTVYWPPVATNLLMQFVNGRIPIAIWSKFISRYGRYRSRSGHSPALVPLEGKVILVAVARWPPVARTKPLRHGLDTTGVLPDS